MKKALFLTFAALLSTAFLFSCNEDNPSDFTIEVSTSGEGSASADKSSATPGDTITLTAVPEEGYALLQWTAVSGDITFENALSAVTTFVMPAENVSVNAEFGQAQPHTVTINVKGSGTATADKTSATAGETVIVTAEPSSTSTFSSWTVESGNVDIENTSANPLSFTMPNSDVVITAEFIDEDYDIFEIITDPVFAAYVRYRMTAAQTIGSTTYPAWDSNMDGTLAPAEIAAIEAISINGGYGGQAASIAGIEKFTGLTYLDVSGNLLTEIDLSNNTGITDLYIGSNSIEDLDFSANTTIRTLDCSYNQLTVLDISCLTELTALACNDNLLNYINMGDKPSLTTMDCSYNELSSVDFSTSPMLTDLTISANKLTSLDLSNNLLLSGLDCWQNPTLEVLDVTKNTELTYISCSGLGITELNVSGLHKLCDISCSNNPFTKLDLSGLTNLQTIWVQNAELTELNIDNCPSLSMVLCNGNHLSELDATGLTLGEGLMGSGNVWTVWGGDQTTVDGEELTMTLYIRPDMKDYWDSSLANNGFNDNVVVEVVE